MASSEFLKHLGTPADRAAEASITEYTLAISGSFAAIIALLASAPVTAAAIGGVALYSGVRSLQNESKAQTLWRRKEYKQPRGLGRVLRP